jgi:hypothetical protein
VLAELPHVRLGRSVFGVRPGTEGPVLELFEAFEEVAFYQFTGWLPARICQLANRKSLVTASSLIARFGQLSVLLAVASAGGSATVADLTDSGFDSDYIGAASDYLRACGFLGSSQGSFYCTSQGKTLVQTLLRAAEKNEAV